MPKRKLSELNGPAQSDSRKLSIKAVRLTNKFEQGVQLISKGLKIARGFERQKLSRREKTAKSQNDAATSLRTTLLRLAEEVEALKGLDYHVTAQRYLFKQLSKTKRIAESSAFKEFQESQNVSTEGPKSTAEANILARLFKSNPVKNVMPGILADIRKLLGIEEIPSGKQSKSGTGKDEPSKEKSKRRQTEESESECAAEVLEEQQKKRNSNTQHGEQDSRPEADLSVSGEDGSENEDFAQFDARLAPGSDSEEESDPGEEIPDADSRAIAADDISDSVSRSPSPDFSAVDSPPPKKAKGSKASAAPAQSTTFLPSLMMGGYWSGSEEASDDEAAAGPPKRKNRMGQQARRALWEKKYGAKANHVQQEQKHQKRNRDSGWDTRKGATDGGSGGRGGRHGGRGGSGEGRPHNRYSDRAGSRFESGPDQGSKPQGPPEDTGPLHPSWEAKRKLKEQTSMAAFQGKKVVFD